MKTRLKIAVSACLLGQAVRYDGKSKPDAFIIEQLAKSAQLIPVCPEVAIGLGTPRPKIEVVQTAAGVRVLGVHDRRIDVTASLAGYAATFLRENPDLAGMVLKSRSPSCGVGDTPLFDTEHREIGLAGGLFATTIIALRPSLPVISEKALPGHAPDFIGQCRRCRETI